MTTETKPSGSFAEAAQAMMGFLSDPSDQQETEASQAKTETDESPELDAEGLTPEAEEGEETESEVEGEPAPRVFKVKVDGEEIEVPESELLQGYSRTQDYTRKTQALAAERRKAEAEYAEVRKEREQYQHLLGQLSEKLEAAPTVDESLQHTDPIRYAQQLAAYMQHDRNRQAVEQEKRRVEALQKQEQQSHLQKYLAEQAEMLQTLIPEWLDAGTAKAEKAKVREAAKAYGYTDDELSELYDARAVALMRDAMRYRELVAKRQEVKPKAGPVVQSRPKAATDDTTRAKQRLAKTGKVADAAAYFLRTL